MPDDQFLTPSFRLSEFLVSQTAARTGRRIVPSQADIDNLKRLCVLVLQPLRDRLGRPVIITSGLRPLWLNAAIGGVKTSMHLVGCAADLGVVGMTHAAVCHNVAKFDLPVDQCILEFDSWVHLGIALPGQTPRKQYLTARIIGGRTVYAEGINA